MKKKMKVILVILVLIVICVGLAFYKIYSELGLKMADPHPGVMDGVECTQDLNTEMAICMLT